MTDDISPIVEFVRKLQHRDSDEGVFNPYQYIEQKFNLRTYLYYLWEKEASILLLGEAGGYNGCRLSGIPFTSGHIIYKNRLFSSIRRHYFYLDIKDKKELSASIVYSFFNDYPELFSKIVMFNAFPFHPHKENNPKTNRKPNKRELEEGKNYVSLLFNIFNFKEYYAIGKVAESILIELQKEGKIFGFKGFRTIRHPSFGGAREFKDTLKEIFGVKEQFVQKTLI